MPEFEEDKINASQSETYTPRTDASDKPRTRRRSGGFKTEVAPVSNAKIGEVDPVKALKEEKLSGQPSSEASEKPARRERSERRERKPRTEREPREPRESKAPRSDANPQPSPETLAAIASVEAKITERRAERDARRAERNKNRPAKSGGKSDALRSSSPKPVAQAESSEGGLIAAIGGFFGKLFGSAPEPAPKKGGSRDGQSRGGRPQGKGGNRGGQNRGRGGKGGNRGGQGRKRGGKGPRRSDRRTNENVSS